MIVNYSSVEMTGNYSPNTQQNIIELTLCTRGKINQKKKKKTADYIWNYFSYFFPEFW